MCPRRVLLADGNANVLQAVTRLLGDDPEIELVGSASSGHEARALVLRFRPDLVVAELRMAKVLGLKAANSRAAEPSVPRIILTSMDMCEEYRLAAEESGADGFLWKPELGKRLIPLIRSILGIE